MEQRVSLITLGVADLARSRVFYEALGWKRSLKELEGVVFFQTGCMALGLYPRDKLAEDATVSAEGSGFSGITLAYNARSREEVDAVFEEALGVGAREVKRPEDVFWGGYSGYFADPDGHLWEVAWNPGFPIDENGAISIPD